MEMDAHPFLDICRKWLETSFCSSWHPQHKLESKEPKLIHHKILEGLYMELIWTLFSLVYITGCPSAQEGNVEWPNMTPCEAATHPCVKYHPTFKGGSVVRKCSVDAETLNLDVSTCSVLESDFNTKFAMVWFTLSGTSGSTYTNTLPAIKRNVSRIQIDSSMYTYTYA